MYFNFFLSITGHSKNSLRTPAIVFYFLKTMGREDCANQCTIFGCCLGMILFAIAGGLRLAQKHTFGTCWVNARGSCARSCDDRLMHCSFSPVYLNTSFQDGAVSAICEWQASQHYTSNNSCQDALHGIGFSGDCVHYAGLCVDPSYAPTRMVVASFFLTISACCMLFFVWGCYSMIYPRKPDRELGVLLAQVQV